MKRSIIGLSLLSVMYGCDAPQKEAAVSETPNTVMESKVKEYAEFTLTTDLSKLSNNQREIIIVSKINAFEGNAITFVIPIRNIGGNIF